LLAIFGGLRLLPFLKQSRRTITVGVASLLLCSATGAAAAAIHRYAVSQATGSGGATTFLQSSVSSSALQGEVASSAQTHITIPFGVLGEYDAATNPKFGVGVIGISTTGYGVGAESFNDNPALIAINASYGDALDAYAKNDEPALYGESTLGGPGVEGFSDEADGVDGFSKTNYSAAISGTDNSSNVGYGIYGGSESTYGTGVIGFSPTGVGVSGESDSGVSGEPAILGYTVHSGTELFRGEITGTDGNLYETATLKTPSGNASGLIKSTAGATNDLQLNGDIAITGNVYTACKYFPADPSSDCNAGTDAVARSNAGNFVQTYGARHANPTMEDEGEARLTNGYAHVSLDPTFASTISTHSPYLVFTTPQGDGALFVSNRTARGFDVRQSFGGRSNMTFDYRIVARQFGRDDRRIAILPPRGDLRPMTSAEAKRLGAIRSFRARHPLTKRPAPRDLVATATKLSR
jgi:hypothetical protein